MTKINPNDKIPPQNYVEKNLGITNSKTPNESLFLKLDKNKDFKISEQELIDAGYSSREASLLANETIFFAERDINKFFRIDRNKDTNVNNIEQKMWDIQNEDDYHKIGDLTVQEFARQYNLEFTEDNLIDFMEWCKHWIECPDSKVGAKARFKEQAGRELTEEETQLLYDAMKYKANRWLFKDDALYQRLNNAAYTRLATRNHTESCCGGDISKPPMGEQPKLDQNGNLIENKDSCEILFQSIAEGNDTNSAYQTKNRLAWAAFKTVPETEAAKMSPEQYAKYQASWDKMRNMTAEDFRELLNVENEFQRERFEMNSNMTVQQIVDYIDIVEKHTGKDFDSNDWSLDLKTFHTILEEINGNTGDETILNGKTRSDVPKDRQKLLQYLEQNDLLLDQFKENPYWKNYFEKNNFFKNSITGFGFDAVGE